MFFKSLILFALTATNALADPLSDAARQYQNGNYQAALSSLRQVPASGTSEYLAGRIHFKLQNFMKLRLR
jgi:predicted S18 family serine protease